MREGENMSPFSVFTLSIYFLFFHTQRCLGVGSIKECHGWTESDHWYLVTILPCEASGVTPALKMSWRLKKGARGEDRVIDYKHAT